MRRVKVRYGQAGQGGQGKAGSGEVSFGKSGRSINLILTKGKEYNGKF